MTKYLLKAWKKAIDVKINLECNKFEFDENPKGNFKSVWYHFCVWFDKEVDNGDIMEEMSEYVYCYAEIHIKQKLNFFTLLKPKKEE